MTDCEKRRDPSSVFAKSLAHLEASHLRRKMNSASAVSPGRILQDGKWYLNFSSNDALGLSQHPYLRERAMAWMEKWGVGSGASRLVTGSSIAMEELERRLAAFLQQERALIFCSGFQANAGVLAALLDSAVVGVDAMVFTDRLIHSSLHFGCATAKVRETRFRHNDYGHLESLLEAAPGNGFRLIVAESLYSMEGDIPDLRRLREIANRYGAFLVVDEAHALGVCGPKGAGLCAVAGVRPDLVVGTFGKAFGSAGAFVACSETIAEYLVNRCASFIYSTAMSPAVLGAIEGALSLIPELEEERARVHRHGKRLRAHLHALGFGTGFSVTHVVPWVIGEPQEAIHAAELLKAEGIMVSAIRPPTVPPGTSRLRFSVSSAHSDEDLDALMAVISEVSELL